MSKEKVFAEINATIPIPEETIITLLSSAFDGGGTSYWASNVIALEENGEFECSEDRLLAGGFRVHLHEKENGKSFCTVIQDDMKMGLRVLATKYPHHFKDIINDSTDAITADAFIQCCCFGDIIYS